LDLHWYDGRNRFILRRNACAREKEIGYFAKTNLLKLTPDLHAFFLEFNGADEDSNLFSFWPLSRVVSVQSSTLNLKKAVAELQEADRYFVFADYMIECWYYAIHLGNNPAFQHRVILPDFPHQPVIASSFSAFLEIYLKDEPKLYGNS
jgi:hypothetical protein